MLPRAAFAIFLAAVCRVSAQEALTDALPAPPAADCTASTSAIKRLARSAPNDVAQFKNARGASMGRSAYAFTRRAHRRRYRVEKRFSHSGDATRPGLSNPFLPIVLRRQTESAAGISGVGRIRHPHFALWHARRWNESAQLGFSPHSDDWRFRD